MIHNPCQSFIYKLLNKLLHALLHHVRIVLKFVCIVFAFSQASGLALGSLILSTTFKWISKKFGANHAIKRATNMVPRG